MFKKGKLLRIESLCFVFSVITMSFSHLDSGPPSLKSKTTHVTAAASTLTVADVSTCTPTPSTQTSLTPSAPAPTTPPAAPPEPSQVDTASTDVDTPQPEDSKDLEVKKDTAESEVRVRHLHLCCQFFLLFFIHSIIIWLIHCKCKLCMKWRFSPSFCPKTQEGRIEKKG